MDHPRCSPPWPAPSAAPSPGSSPAASASAAPAPAHSAAAASPAAAAAPVARGPLLGPVVHQEGLQGEVVGQQVVADVVAPDAEGLQADGVAVLEGHLDALHVGGHGDVDAGDGAADLGAVLQLQGHRLVTKLHQESGKMDMN